MLHPNFGGFRPIVGTTTFYKDVNDVRCQLALQTLIQLNELGIPSTVVDGSPNQEVQEHLAQHATYYLTETDHGMGASRRQALGHAVQIPTANIYIWMEPEKVDFVRFIPELVRAMKYHNLIIPHRVSLESYPPHQQMCEKVGNRQVQDILGVFYDWWSGPRVMDATTVQMMLAYMGEWGPDKWDGIFCPFVTALANPNLRVGSQPIDYVHPAAQTRAEYWDPQMNEKRNEQLMVLVEAMRKVAIHYGLYPE